MTDEKTSKDRKPNLKHSITITKSKPRIEDLLGKATEQTKTQNQFWKDIGMDMIFGTINYLEQSITNLKTKYLKLEADHQELNGDYQLLKEDYTEFNEAFRGLANDHNKRIGNAETKISGIEKQMNDSKTDAYTLVKIDAKQARFLDGETEINLFDNPKKVYDEFQIEIPGQFSDVSKIELVYLKSDGQLYKKERQVLETTTCSEKTVLNIGRYKLPSDTVKIGFGVYGKNLYDNKKGD